MVPIINGRNKRTNNIYCNSKIKNNVEKEEEYTIKKTN
jgi:hypothetical protein